MQLVSALGSAHGVLGFAHVASHVSVRVVLDEQLAGLGVCGQRWEVTQVQILCYSTEVDLSVVYTGISFYFYSLHLYANTYIGKRAC